MKGCLLWGFNSQAKSLESLPDLWRDRAVLPSAKGSRSALEPYSTSGWAERTADRHWS
jgi:hypothetical protein